MELTHQPNNESSVSNLAIYCSNLNRVYTRRVRESGLRGAVKSFFSSKYESKAAISNVNLKITKSSCTGLVGANGAGKTTLLKMCAGLLHPTEGDISVLGFRPADRRPDFQRRIGMVMGQKSQLWVDIPAMETFELLASIYQIPEELFRRRVRDLTEIFRVGKVLNTQVRRLSLGERMKLEIMAALLHGPELLILDEPTIGLDVVARRNIREFIKNYNAEFKTTIIISSHDMSDIEEICSNLILVADGKILFDGALADFENRYRSHKKFNLRNVEFHFDLGQSLTEASARDICSKTQANLLHISTGESTFQADRAKLSTLISEVVKCATPVDIKIEEQSLETLVHELMTNQESGALH